MNSANLKGLLYGQPTKTVGKRKGALAIGAFIVHLIRKYVVVFFSAHFGHYPPPAPEPFQSGGRDDSDINDEGPVGSQYSGATPTGVLHHILGRTDRATTGCCAFRLTVARRADIVHGEEGSAHRPADRPCKTSGNSGLGVEARQPAANPTSCCDALCGR